MINICNICYFLVIMQHGCTICHCTKKCSFPLQIYSVNEIRQIVALELLRESHLIFVYFPITESSGKLKDSVSLLEKEGRGSILVLVFSTVSKEESIVKLLELMASNL